MRASTVVIAALVACGGDKEPPKDKDGNPVEHTGTETHTGTPIQWECVIEEATADSAHQLGCEDDFAKLASLPVDVTIPGARSIKTLVDRADDEKLWFANSVEYPIHWEFAAEFLNGDDGLPPVADLATFNLTEYYSPDRRFLLGAVTYYEGADAYVYELSPYDTSDATMLETAFDLIRDNTYFGRELKFHPTSQSIESLLPLLPDDIPIITTDELFAGIDYQPYNFGTTTGLLAFHTADEVAGTYTPYRELVVLDAVPLDISVTAGIITAEFQTPLSHINVLSVNRGTPNMALRNAFDDPELRALEGKWVELTVSGFEYTIREISAAEAEEWWQENKPDPLTVPAIDSSITDLRDVEDIIDDAQLPNGLPTEISTKIRAFGSKGTNYAALVDISDDFPIQREAFVIPFYWYQQHMANNGLLDQLIAMQADPRWLSQPEWRYEQLDALKVAIVEAPIDPVFLQMVLDKVAADFPTETDVRFRSSTNAEDLGNFTGAGLYNSQTGRPELEDLEIEDSVSWAIKTAWSNLWNPRAYEERDYYSIDQMSVGMALLTTPNFPDEEANGVAITNNIFDSSGLEPAFYVNVQPGDAEVVQPEPGVVPDAFLHFWYYQGQPVVYITNSNLIRLGTTVLTNQQIHDLGSALADIHSFFYSTYGADGGWYGMDVEFKFDDKNDPGNPQLFIKQARPFPWDPSAGAVQ
jgi:hypothetical protein